MVLLAKHLPQVTMICWFVGLLTIKYFLISLCDVRDHCLLLPPAHCAGQIVLHGHLTTLLHQLMAMQVSMKKNSPINIIVVIEINLILTSWFLDVLFDLVLCPCFYIVLLEFKCKAGRQVDNCPSQTLQNGGNSISGESVTFPSLYTSLRIFWTL